MNSSGGLSNRFCNWLGSPLILVGTHMQSMEFLILLSCLRVFIFRVPDCEGSKENTYELTRTAYGRRFMDEELNSYLEFLFELIVTRGPAVGLNTKLNRYDLFHGHLFIAIDTGGVGILFHAKEYPIYDKEVFPCNMGYCQKVLVVLDAHPEGIIFRDLIPEYVQIARTIYEDDLGALVVDVNYLNVGDGVPNYQIFMC